MKQYSTRLSSVRRVFFARLLKNGRLPCGRQRTLLDKKTAARQMET